MMRGSIAAAVAFSAFAAAPEWALSELIVTSFTITPSSSGAGTPVDVRFGVFNGGDAAVDGCSRTLSSTLPTYCRVDESVEADNTRRVILGAP
jgi:hypothetical protein